VNNLCEIVIVNFNTGSFLKSAVESALQSRSVWRVHVVDNASTDTSLDFLSERYDDRLKIIRNQANIGFAAACNIGLAQVTSDHALLLNPDCWVAEGAIENLITALRTADEIGLAGPLLLNPDGSEQAAGRRKFPTPSVVFTQMFSIARLVRYIAGSKLPVRDQPPRDLIEVEAISGACMMVRRKAAIAVGPLDEQYYLHWEDLDWCMRFRRQGWKIVFAPEAKVFHQKGVSSRHRRFAIEYYKHRGMVRFYQKFLRNNYSRSLVALMTFGVWVRFGGVIGWLLLCAVTERIFAAFAGSDR
jgi:GT2 family glycosyltransferase